MKGGFSIPGAPVVQSVSAQQQMQSYAAQDARNLALTGGGGRGGGGGRTLNRARRTRKSMRSRRGHHMNVKQCKHHLAHIPCTASCRRHRTRNRRKKRTRGILRKSRASRAAHHTRRHPKSKRRVRWAAIGGNSVQLGASATPITQHLAQQMANVNAAKQVM